MAPERMYKFGRTNSENVMERFDPQVHLKRKWRNTPLALDYDVKVLWSVWVTKQEATEAEKWFEANHPKTFFTEEKYNGIKECRDWKPKQSFAFSAELEKRYPKSSSYWKEVEERKSNNTLQKTHDKIYFVMLTKK